MRKITLFMTLFCMLVGTVFAQTQPQIGNFYRIKDNTRSKYLTIRSYNANSGGSYGTVPVLEEGAGNSDQVWELVDVDANNNQYKFRSKSNYYLQCRGWNCDAVSTGGSTITIEEASTSGEYYLKNGSNYFKVENINDDGGTSHPFCDAPFGNANIVTWSFIPVSDSEVFEDKITVTYIYKLNGVVYTTVQVEQTANSDVNVPVQNFLTVQSTSGSIGNVNCDIIVNCSENLPFAVTSSLDNPIWQVVEMHRYNGNRYWEYDIEREDGKVDVVYYTDNKIDVVAENKLWCFVGDLISGFKIYNKAVMSKNPSWTLNATDGNPTMGDAVEGNDVWHLASSTAATGSNVACFTHNEGSYMNRNSGGQLAYYTAADNGSTCYFFQPKELVVSAVENVVAALNGSSIADIPEGAIGIIDKSSESAQEFKRTYDLVSNKANPDMSELTSLAQSAKKAWSTITLPTSGYYFIYGTGIGNQTSWRLTYEGTKCYARSLAEGEALSAKHVWSFAPVEDGFKLRSCNLDKYLTIAAAPAVSDVVSDFSNGYKFTFASDGCGRFTIKDGNGNVVRTENGGDINYWSGEANETWYLVPARELELTVGEAGYATTHLPFAVTLPEDGSLEAYAATNVGTSSVTLTPKNDIPANQGAILKGVGTHKLTIVDTATSDWADNKLEGTNVATYVEGLSYVLANGANGVGMYLAALNKTENGSDPAEGGTGTHFLNNANKAYLPVQATEENPSRSLVFSFGGEETAIKDINGVENSGKTVIYDLSGRRVQKLGKGLYIVNGKKVVM